MTATKRLFIATQGFRPFATTIIDGSTMLGPVKECIAVLRSSDVRIAWPVTEGVTTFTLSKSIDGGKTFSQIATATNLTTDPLYDATLELFVFDDVTGTLGHLYLLSITDGLRTGIPCIATPELDPALVSIFGVILAADGSTVDEVMRRVILCPVGDDSVSDTSIPGVQPDVIKEPFTVFASEDGFWQAHLLAGHLVEIRIPAIGFQRTVRIPTNTSRAYAIEELRGESSLSPDGDC